MLFLWTTLLNSKHTQRGTTNEKLNEGPGAGYTVSIKDLRLRNVELSAPAASDKVDDVVIEFKADVALDYYPFTAKDMTGRLTQNQLYVVKYMVLLHFQM